MEPAQCTLCHIMLCEQSSVILNLARMTRTHKASRFMMSWNPNFIKKNICFDPLISEAQSHHQLTVDSIGSNQLEPPPCHPK